MSAEAEVPFSRMSPPYHGSPEQWKAWADGLAIPAVCGLRTVEIGGGRAVMVLEQSPWIPNPNGSLNGGLVLAAADQIAGVVSTTVMDPDELPSTATLNTEFYRPAFTPVTFIGTVTRRGRTMIFVQVDVERADGQLAMRAHGIMAPSRPSFHVAQ